MFKSVAMYYVATTGDSGHGTSRSKPKPRTSSHMVSAANTKPNTLSSPSSKPKPKLGPKRPDAPIQLEHAELGKAAHHVLGLA